MYKKHSTTVTDTTERKQCMVHASDRKFPQRQVNNAWYLRPTITATVAGKQCIVHPSDRKFSGKQYALINQSRPTGTLHENVYNQNEEWRMGNTNALFPRRQLWTGRHGARLQLCIFSYESITSQNHTIALIAIISWKVGKDLVEIQQTGIIILMLTFSS